MIGRISGALILKTDRFVIIDTNGVGYKVSVSVDTLAKLPAPSRLDGDTPPKAELWIHTAVREDALDLYGFLDREELRFFELLIDVSGIGPKGALGIIGMGSLDTLKRAIASGDTAYLTKVSGIGKKTAERIVIDLRDKLAKEGHATGSQALRHESDALDALMALGYGQTEARDALKEIGDSAADTNAKVKEALRILGEKR